MQNKAEIACIALVEKHVRIKGKNFFESIGHLAVAVLTCMHGG